MDHDAGLSSSSISTTDPEEVVSTSSNHDDSVEVILEDNDSGSQLAFSESIPTREEECSEEEHTAPPVISTSDLLSIPGNQKCFDCNIDHPLWINITYCIFLCGPCAAIHAEFGLQVKPLSDPRIKQDELVLLSKTGNSVASLFWLAMWGHDKIELLPAHAPRDVRTNYIVAKYRGKWLHPQDKAVLASVQHAFAVQPEFFAPPAYDNLIAQTQQLALHGSYGGSNGGHGGHPDPAMNAAHHSGVSGPSYTLTYHVNVNNGTGQEVNYGYTNGNGPNNHLPGYVQAPNHPAGYNHRLNGNHGYHDHNTHYLVNGKSLTANEGNNGIQQGTTHGVPLNGKENANPNFVMNNTAAYSKKSRSNKRPSY